ncbi:MAG: phosphoribosylamine--glycine ligase [Chloroflexota bacterium]
MKVLVVGSGAREHALAWKLGMSPRVKQIFTAPGNAGTAQIGQNLNISPTDVETLGQVARERRFDLVVVGPEAALAAGIVDHFQEIGIPVFGPDKAAARIESSKVFAKELMQQYGLPSPGSITFTDFARASDYIKKHPAPLVIKADGLAAGKGVTVAETTPQALAALAEMMQARAFGIAGDRVIIEDKLVGREVSALAFTDGRTVVPMVPACDYKPVYDGNRGPNTGGMGSYSPPPFYHARLAKRVQQTILEPAVKAMSAEGHPYRGVLYAGLMVNTGRPKVLEFNARFGDPETQVILPRLKTDLVEIIMAVINGRLDQIKVAWHRDTTVGVVLASGGYPGSYARGLPVTGLDKLDRDVLVFHAGTSAGPAPGEVLTSGGRVLTVVATGPTLAEAREKVYANISRIHLKGGHYRRDIAEIKEADKVA